MAEDLVGIAILHHCLSRFHPLPSDWFRFSLNGKWQFDVALAALRFHWSTSSHRSTWICYLFFPLHLLLSQVLSNQLLHEIRWQWHSMRWLFQFVPPFGRRLYSVGSFSLHWRSTCLCGAQFWWVQWLFPRCILICRGCYHLFSLRWSCMGAVFAQSRNLLASMLLHSLWNAFVFLELMK